MNKYLLLMLSAISLIGCGLQSDFKNQATSHQKNSDSDIKNASKRWMADRNIKDFQLLCEHLPTGVSVHQVETLLGDPHGHTQDEGHEYFEYIANDHANKGKANWSAEFDEDGILIEWAYNEQPK
jgi:hypothetical protein